MLFEFIRPEIRTHIWRFRDAYIGASVTLLGVYLAVIGLGIVPVIGVVVAVGGAFLTFSGIQRGRFQTGGGGLGVVYVNEGQVTYFGPQNGGAVALENLVQIDLYTDERGKREWILRDSSFRTLNIPVDAEGADALFDSFTSLDRLKIEKMLGNLASAEHGSVTIWQASGPMLH